MTDKKQLEEGFAFTPSFDEKGLIPCITVCAQSGRVLMMAYMNAQALEKTLETHEAHYWSRSRGALWHKGATSGFVQKVIELRTDCDQDCLLLRVQVVKPADAKSVEGTCHTGRECCFYRAVDLSGDQKTLVFKDD